MWNQLDPQNLDFENHGTIFLKSVCAKHILKQALRAKLTKKHLLTDRSCLLFELFFLSGLLSWPTMMNNRVGVKTLDYAVFTLQVLLPVGQYYVIWTFLFFVKRDF